LFRKLVLQYADFRRLCGEISAFEQRAVGYLLRVSRVIVDDTS